MEFNNITSISYQSLNGLRSLKILQLNNNLLRNLTQSVFSHLTAVESINLANNKLRQLSVNAFSKLRNLRTLNLRNNELGVTIAPDSISYEMIKQVLGIDSNYFDAPTVLAIDALSPDNLPNLTKLDLGGNHFQLIARYWSPFSSNGQAYRAALSGETADDKIDAYMWFELKELLLDNCGITFIEPGSFEGLISLSILKLNDNNLEVSTLQECQLAAKNGRRMDKFLAPNAERNLRSPSY